MNINTGGPHILLFERDQQLTGLLISEFQLAGYECHTARTAVEVFDAIARQPIRLVLVNLAQAAAARKEFWVALDTQRRGRGVHVLTYQVTNLGSYGASDPEDRPQTMTADIAVEGMLGIMTLVDAVRARVTGNSSGTLPRIKATPPPPTPSTGGYRPAQQSSTTASTMFSTSSAAPPQRAQISPETGPQPITRPAPPGYSQPSLSSFTPNAVPPTPSNAGHSEKIRAVLYPNQRWSSPQNTTSFSTAQDHLSASRPSYDPQATIVPPAPAPETTMLQRLANGQLNAEESGLAQLSRMLRERQEYQAAPSSFATQPSNDLTYGAPSYQQPAQPAYTPPSPPEPPAPAVSPSTISYTAPTARPAPATENISAQPLRASPIQDMPIERPTIPNSSQAHQTLTDGIRRPDVLSRTNYGQQPQQSAQPAPPTQPAQSQQAAPSIPTTLSSAPPSAPASMPPLSTFTTLPAQPTSTASQAAQPAYVDHEDQYEPVTTHTVPNSPSSSTANKLNGRLTGQEVEQDEADELDGDDFQTDTNPESRNQVSNNAILLDIMQSLPPMPAPVPQPSGPPVLSGRATRSLGSVLLEGHLVPQSRLEVAQNVQRMLRGVDLNYQLGEILLMFKLLTPDQLLAASLVSYGLISTTQIIALGRIRQELHSIGLEYDLENLLILFRILTPEQLREVKSSWQG